VLAILFGGGVALVASLLGTRVAINGFTKLGYGQEIREDGPTSHHTKRGTPTMGGVAFILASLLGYIAAKVLLSVRAGDLVWPSASALLLLFLFVGMGSVGFLDDFIKVAKQRNLGLRSKAKMIGQTVIAVVFGLLALSPWLADDNGRTPASEKVSFIREIDWLAIGTFFTVVLIWFLVTGFSNAVNLTDGLDGLAAGACALVFGAYALMNIFQNQNFCQADPGPACYNVRDPLDLAIIAACISGACVGFLWWNASPAQIFMGDTGSLALGGAIAGLAVLTRTELLVIILGGLFVLETLSVMLQVSFFKLSKGKRIFRMAPIHHHFEMLGWEQVTVVIRFWIICGLFIAVGLGMFYADWVALGGAG
jgi:phospho-N-acetylmuramoyl-pentapeptide-transferase